MKPVAKLCLHYNRALTLGSIAPWLLLICCCMKLQVAC